ncbi:MAG: SWIM zinc finger family protein, partial [Chloroflexi bacterium]|nr:SWIM zinc finger family protein [Chloroflexota bacterium]
MLGSRPQPYQVRISWDEDGLPVDAECTCPAFVEMNRYCKHIAAAAIAACGRGALPAATEDALARLPQRVLLERLSAADLRELWQQLASAAPEFDDLLRLRLMAKDAATNFSQPILAQAVDAFVRYALEHNPLAEVWSWAILKILQELLRQGHPRGLEALAAVTDALLAIPDWYRYGYVQGQDSVLNFAEEVGWAWARAMLALPLAPKERRTWARWLRQRVQKAEHWGLDWYALDRAAEA